MTDVLAAAKARVRKAMKETADCIEHLRLNANATAAEAWRDGHNSSVAVRAADLRLILDALDAGAPIIDLNADMWRESAQQVAGDYQALRTAGGALAEAALFVATNYDGCHRIHLAVAEWCKVVANEGGRGVRYSAPPPPAKDDTNEA